MIRRQFIKLATLAGATGLASLATLDAIEKQPANTTLAEGETKTVAWRVHGFTCVTCAVGLEVLLRKQRGVVSAEASYPDATVTIQFHPEQISEPNLRNFITDMGFTTDEHKA